MSQEKGWRGRPRQTKPVLVLMCAGVAGPSHSTEGSGPAVSSSDLSPLLVTRGNTYSQLWPQLGRSALKVTSTLSPGEWPKPSRDVGHGPWTKKQGCVPAEEGELEEEEEEAEALQCPELPLPARAFLKDHFPKEVALWLAT